MDEPNLQTAMLGNMISELRLLAEDSRSPKRSLQHLSQEPAMLQLVMLSTLNDISIHVYVYGMKQDTRVPD